MLWGEYGFDYAPAIVRPELDDVAQRAVAAGAKPPLEYVGAGMTGVVLMDARSRAYKVARHVSPLGFASLHTEYEWLKDAHKLDPKRVVKPIRFDPDNIVLVKEYVEGRPVGWAPSEVHRQFSELAKRMQALDWSAPEYKDDSFIKTEDGVFVLVDAGMAQRLCTRLVKHTRALLSGKLHPWAAGTRPEDYQFLLRREAGEGCVDPDVAESLGQRMLSWHQGS